MIKSEGSYRKIMSIEEQIRYKEREKRWIKREKMDREDLEAWKTSAIVSLLEF